MISSFHTLLHYRQQLQSLTMQHRKDIETIKSILTTGCNNSGSFAKSALVVKTPEKNPDEPFIGPVIGTVKTVFSNKRAVPRQAVLADEVQGCVEISSDCFNNPEHSLEGLEEFSHMWIIYHFHRNESHSKAKVAPPRLNGGRVGVFSTRSPHRPCPIGLSLVRIDRIEDNKVYFFGTDMVDGSPVLDLKPYIPKYDCPTDDMAGLGTAESPLASTFSAREAPDGQETEEDTQAASSSTSAGRATGTVRVPNWITAGPTLKVLFQDQALAQIDQLTLNRNTIAELLETDPRSVYLRTKHGSQIFTFQLSEATVTCKFDDSSSTVVVLQVRV